MATTQILPFTTLAAGSGGNRLSPTAYAALTTLLADGFQSGVAESDQVNTVLAQATFMAAGLANWIVSKGISVPDDGNLSNLVTEIDEAISIASGNYYVDSGSADVYVITPSPAVGSYVNGLTFRVKIAHTNTTTTPTLNVNSLGAVVITRSNGSAIVAGDIAAGFIATFVYSSATSRFLLVSSTNAATYLQATNNLSDLASVATALGNLGFVISVSGNQGYIQFPAALGGLMIVFGEQFISTGNGDVVTLPVSFPTNIFNVVATDAGGGAHTCGWGANGASLSSFLGYGRIGSASASVTYNYIAIGN